MLYTNACIYFIIGILTIGFALFVTAIGRLGDRYESAFITDIFKQEPVWQHFTTFLFLSVSISLVHVAVSIFTLGNNSGNVKDYARALLTTGTMLYLATLGLIINILRFVNLGLIYFSAQKLINHFKTKTEMERYPYFRSLADIFYVAIKREFRYIIRLRV